MKQLLPIFLIASALSIFSSGCCSQRKASAGVAVHDTVTVTKLVKVRDTVLPAPGASVSAVIDLLQWLGSAHQGAKGTEVLAEKQHKQAHLKVAREGNTLMVECGCDSMAIYAQLRDTYAKETHHKATVQTVVERIKYVPATVKVLAWIGGFCVAGFLGLLVKKFWL